MRTVAADRGWQSSPEPMLLALAIILLTAALAAVVLQLLIPWIAERRISERLTESGGEARVRVDALPALRLLRHDGDRLKVRGEQLVIGLSNDGSGGLTALDGFDEVEVVLTDFVTGPFRISEFVLRRSGQGPYVMTTHALTSGAELVRYGGAQVKFLPAALLGSLTRAPLGGREFPVEVEVELRSEEGRLRIASGGGTIAGYPAGPIAAVVTAAVARRLEIGVA